MTEFEYQEINSQINAANQKIKEAFLSSPNTFELNPEITKQEEIIKDLQAKCEHQYESYGFCKHCYKKEDQ